MDVKPCTFGKLHRDGRRVICFADWHKEYGVPAWFNRNGYLKTTANCFDCPKRPKQ